MFTVQIKTRIVGSTLPDQGVSEFALELLHEELTVAELIAHTVTEQIQELTLIRKLTADAAQKIIERQYLCDADIDRMAVKGTVKMPTVKVSTGLNEQQKVLQAQRAFENGTYTIIVDGEQVLQLDDVVRLHPTSKVTFLRLMPLVGG